MKVHKKSIENIVETIYLPDYFKRFLEVKRSGNNAMAKCPFHEDSSPSLYIYPDHYHCFGCNAHGNVIDYEMHRSGSSFREVIENLAQTYQITLEYEGNLTQKTIEVNAEDERKNKILQEMLALFKQNPKINMAQDFQDMTEFYYSGSHAQCQKFLNEEMIGHKFDFSERFVFPVYQDNNKVCGFVFSKKIPDTVRDNKVTIDVFLDFLTEQFLYQPFPNQFFHCVNWNAARAISVREKELFVVTNLRDLFFFLQKKILNVCVCVQDSIEFNLAKNFARRVPKITLVIPAVQYGHIFLWKTFLNSVTISDFSIRTLFLPGAIEDIQNFLQKFSLEEFKKWLENSKTIYDEVTHKVLEKYSSSEKLSVFKKTILPVLNRIDDDIRRKNIFSDLALEHFGSRPSIFWNTAPIKSVPEDKVTKTVEVSEGPANSFHIEAKGLLGKVVDFYHKILLSRGGTQAREYLESRGISLADMKTWRLGFCPMTNELSSKIDKKNDSTLTGLLELGILKKGQNSRSHSSIFDFFGGRIIIPIYDHAGLPAALSGRIFLHTSESSTYKNKTLPKYINSQESAIFSKSSILFNYYNAVKPIMDCGYVIVVEGYMDCISLVNLGIKNVVAVMGTALTASHMDSLVSLTKRIVVCFDNDKAGQNAAKRAFAAAFFYRNVEIEYLPLPDSKDPDEYIKTHGSENFLNLISQQRSLLEQICDWLYVESKGEKEEFFQLIKKQVLPTLANQIEPEKRDEALRFLCQKYFQNIYPSDLMKEIEKIAAQNAKVQNTPPLVKEVEDWPIKSQLELKLLFALIHLDFSSLPERVKNVVQGNTSLVEANEKICALALEQQLTPVSFSILLEILSIMHANLGKPLVSIQQSSPLGAALQCSSHVKILLAYARGDAYELLRYNLQELLKEKNYSRDSMLSFKNVWDPVNSSFLSFLLQNIRLFLEKEILLEFVAESLLKLELAYIDYNLKEVSSFHYNNELSEQFQILISERARRLQEFG